MPHHRMIDSGSTVYGSDGQKIGTVKDCTETYCHIDTGFLGLGPDYYIPMENIADSRPGEVFLDLPSDRVGRMGWDHEPVGRPMQERTERAGVAEERTRPASERAERSIPLEEEQIRATTHTERVGEVEIGKEVREEERQFTVPVSHEEVVITRHDVDRPADQPIGEGETVRIPLSEERVEVHKEPRVYGEVEVEKRRVTEERPVSGTVRKEVPEVRKRGDVEDKIAEEGEPRREEWREREK